MPTNNNMIDSNNVPGRKFGVEIELIGLTESRAVEVLNNIGINVRSSFYSDYNHAYSNIWKVTSDASIVSNGRGGCEVVSPVLQGYEGLEAIMKVCKALSDAGATVNKSCGLHVHIDTSDLNADHARSIVTRYAQFESTIDAFMPVSRRSSNNHNCASMISNIQYYGRNKQHYSENLSTFCGNLNNRYVKVNTTAFARHGTIEFRHHSGSVNGTKITNWVMFVLQFVEHCKAIAPTCLSLVRTVEEQTTVTVRNPRYVEPTYAYECGVTTMPERPLLQNPSYNVTYGHRKLLNKLWDNRNSYVTVGVLASHTYMNVASIPSYISTIRRAYGVRIKNSRRLGYMLVSETPVAPAPQRVESTEPMWIQESRTVTRTVYPTEHIPRVADGDSLWNGISPDIKSYYEERMMELA